MEAAASETLKGLALEKWMRGWIAGRQIKVAGRRFESVSCGFPTFRSVGDLKLDVKLQLETLFRLVPRERKVSEI